MFTNTPVSWDKVEMTGFSAAAPSNTMRREGTPGSSSDCSSSSSRFAPVSAGIAKTIASGERMNSHLSGDSISVCGNLPYHIAAPLLFKVLSARDVVRHAVVMIQKEMADRIVASPGGKDYGALGVMIRTYADVSVVAKVGAEGIIAVGGGGPPPSSPRECPLGNAGLRTRILRQIPPLSGAATETRLHPGPPRRNDKQAELEGEPPREPASRLS